MRLAIGLVLALTGTAAAEFLPTIQPKPAIYPAGGAVPPNPQLWVRWDDFADGLVIQQNGRTIPYQIDDNIDRWAEAYADGESAPWTSVEFLRVGVEDNHHVRSVDASREPVSIRSLTTGEPVFDAEDIEDIYGPLLLDREGPPAPAPIDGDDPGRDWTPLVLLLVGVLMARASYGPAPRLAE